MSRIRSIKPEFWTSEQVLECSTNARLLFIGLWNFCDDSGRHPYSAKQAKAEVFPSDPFSEKQVLGMLDELSANGLITKYVSGGKEYFYVNGWRHQRIDKPQAAKYPDPSAEHSTIIPGTFPPDRKGEDTKGKDSIERAPGALDDDFEKLRAVYPKRKGGDPRKSAFAVFSTLVRGGADPNEIVAAARDGIGFDREKAGTEFIPQLVKWLRDERFRDRPPAPKEPVISGFYVAADTPQMDAWMLYERAGKKYPRDRNGGWHFPSEYPPGYKNEAA